MILAEQQERNAVLLDNERLVADFEQLRTKVKETIDVQETQKALSKDVVTENVKLAEELKRRNKAFKDLQDSTIAQYEICAQFKIEA